MANMLNQQQQQQQQQQQPGMSMSNASSTSVVGAYNNNLSTVDCGNIVVGNNSISIDNSGNIQHLRDVCNMLSTVNVLPTGECAYDHIISLMRGLDLQDDGIVLNQKIKTIETDFCNIVHDESMLCESMEYINDKALGDNQTALKFAMLFSSRNFDALAMKETKVRSAMLKLLETNYLNAKIYRMHDKNRLYNSITLLGEYYHRVRLANNSPIIILGQSLLQLLITEIEGNELIEWRLARLILSQITLNGSIMRLTHKVQLAELFFHIRRHLIEQAAMKSCVKALLLMTLDLFYCNYKALGDTLESMYTKYLIQNDEAEEHNFTLNHSFGTIIQTQAVVVQPLQQQVQPIKSQTHFVETPLEQSFENSAVSSNTDNANDSYEIPPTTTKKWSEQVCEEAIYECEFIDYQNDLKEHTQNSNYDEPPIEPLNTRYEQTTTRQARRNYQAYSPSRALKQNHTEHYDSNNTRVNEENDESKPLPRWRMPRFNRYDDNEHYNSGRSRNQQQQQNRRSIVPHPEDDHQSVRSEGGSLRLYSINDRLKHSQERFERRTGHGAQNYNHIVNSNWDRQSQHDDRSERSYASNYERGNYKRNGGGGGARFNRYTYDKPPRFQKQHENQKAQAETWRRRSNPNVNQQQDEQCNNSNGPESNSRSSSRARTLPRPAKSNMDNANYKNKNGDGDANKHPHHSHHQQQQKQRYGRNFHARYSSQSSLTSEGSNTFDRRNQQKHRNFKRSSQQNEQQQQHQEQKSQQQQQHQHEQEQKQHEQQQKQLQIGDWNAKDESELVRNAQQTTKYMNYLSAQK